MFERNANSEQKGTSAVTKTVLPILGIGLCTGCILFILASTIVLALIPVYLGQKSATRAVITSHNVLLYMQIEDNNNNGRKRQTDTLGNLAGAKFGAAGVALVKQQLENIMRENDQTDGITDPDITITSEASNITSQQATIAKLRNSFIHVLKIEFRVRFKMRCDTSCQNNNGIKVEKILKEKISQSTTILVNIPISRNGVELGTISLHIIGCLDVTPIRSALIELAAMTERPTASTTASTTMVDNRANGTTDVNAANFDSTTSDNVTLYIEINQQSDDQPSGTASLENFVGAKFGPAGVASVKQQLEIIMKEDEQTDGITDPDITITHEPVNRRRRDGTISKRLALKYTLQIVFRIRFKMGCDPACQDENGLKLENILKQNILPLSISLLNIPLTRNGIQLTTISFWIVRFVSVTRIRREPSHRTTSATTALNTTYDRFTSNPVITYFPLTDSSIKRETGNKISDAVGGIIDDITTLNDIKNKILTIMNKTNEVKTLTDLNCTIALIAISRRRRLAILKRASSIGQPALRCRYFVVFFDTCITNECQDSTGSRIELLMTTDPSLGAVFTFDQLVVTVNGVEKNFKCKLDGNPIITSIRSQSSNITVTDVVTLSTTITTTLPDVTNGING